MAGKDKNPAKKVVSACVNADHPMLQAKVTGRVRTNLSVLHLIAAAQLSRRVGEIEDERLSVHGTSPYNEVFPFCSACVLESVASLEAYINEVLTDKEKHFSPPANALLERLGEYVERQQIMEKYGFALFISGKPEFHPGRKPAQSIASLIKLRNALVHFRPEWDDEQDEHAKLSKVLCGKFKLSPFFEKSVPAFPKAWATHGCTVWAVNSCLSYMREFEKRMGLRAKFDKHIEQIKP